MRLDANCGGIRRLREDGAADGREDARLRVGEINCFLYYNDDRHLGETRENKDDTPERRQKEDTMKHYEMNLRLFDGEGGTAGTAAAGATTTGAETGAAGGESRDFNAEFDTMVKGEYKDAFDARVQKIVQGRLKNSKQTESKLKDAEGLLAMVGERYNLDGKDFTALKAALEGDRQYLEAEALEKGMTVEQLAQFKKMERENKAFQEQIAQNRQRQEFEQKFAAWTQEAEQLKGKFPELDLATEFDNPEFVRMLDHGISVGTAYQAVHFDDLMGGALQHTAATTERKVLDSIRARGARPAENGASGSSGAREKPIDVTKLTKQQRNELIERARRNPDERITFS